MDGRSATLAALGVAVLGIVASLMLEGVAAGLVLFAAGVLLVVIGIFGWHEPTPSTALADASIGGDAPMEPSVRELGDPDSEIGTADPVDAAPASEREEVTTGTPDLARLSRTLAERLDQVRERVNEEITAPPNEPGEAGTVTDPLSSRRTASPAEGEPVDAPAAAATPRPRSDPRTDVEPEPGPGPVAATASEPEAAPVGAAAPVADHGGPGSLDVPSDAGSGHDHDQPLLNHSDLVSHVRDHHEGVRTDGSTIQLRLLHEREHGATA